MTDLTLLRLSPIGIPPYSARGITQSLSHIDAAVSQRRTVNGVMVDLSVPELRKYQSTISCTDQQHPALSGVWPGRILTVDCVSELSYADNTDGAAERTVVSGSQRTEDGFVFYRPRLTMMVVSYETSFDEWGADVNWTMKMVEV